MDPKLKAICDLLIKHSNYEIRWVHMWHEIGTVDSEIYDTYEEAALDINDRTTVVPVLLEKEEV